MKQKLNPENFIVPLDMNGLKGRMLHLPSLQPKNTEILLVNGQHSSLERWWGLTQDLNSFGAVTMPDLPGIGGMESFYKIRKEPNINNFADYLAAFIKMRYRQKKVVIIGISFGFAVVTRMLQRYPELAKKVTLLISIGGFTHADDFSISGRRRSYYLGLARIVSSRLASLMFRRIALNSVVLRTVYRHKYISKPKIAQNLSRQDNSLKMEIEIWLWQHNDLRTRAAITSESLVLDNCRKQINLSVWQVITEDDHYIDYSRLEQHLRVIFSEVNVARPGFRENTPDVVAGQKSVYEMLPAELRLVMSQL